MATSARKVAQLKSSKIESKLLFEGIVMIVKVMKKYSTVGLHHTAVIIKSVHPIFS